MAYPNDYTCSIADSIYKQSQADWLSGTPNYSYGSVTLRPDAFSSDYNIGYSYGPTNIGFIESGAIDRVWKIEAVSGSGIVTLYRATDDGVGFDTGLLLFSYAGPTINEIDLAFDMVGRAVVSADRMISGSMEIWFYYYKPSAASYVFEKITNGRTPRAILDRPEALEASDILLIYTSGSDNKVFYRQQRDNYTIEYYIPVPVPQSVSGSFNGYCQDGAISGSMTGSMSGSIVGTWQGSRFDGSFVGTGSGDSVGVIFESTSSRATGSFEGALTGSLSGSLDGLYNSIRFWGPIYNGPTASDKFFGRATGSYSGSINAYVYRNRTTQLVGGFIGYLSGSVSHSIFGSSTGNGTIIYASITGSADGLGGSDSNVFSYLEGSLSGSATGTIAGNLFGYMSGSDTNVYSFYLEDAVKMSDSRIGILYSRRNRLTAKYKAGTFETVFYPHRYFENISASFTLVTSSLLQSVFYGYLNSESFTSFSLSFVTASLQDMIQSYGGYYPESISSMSLLFVTASLNDVTISTPIYYPESFTSFNLSFVTASLES